MSFKLTILIPTLSLLQSINVLALDSVISDDHRLDVTIALGFEQREHGNSGIPILGPIIDQIQRLTWDDATIGSDLRIYDALIHQKFPTAQINRQISRGQRTYTFTQLVEGDVVQVRIKIIHPQHRLNGRTLVRRFRESMHTDDVLIYNGHSREGRALIDFGPPAFGRKAVFRHRAIRNRWQGFDRENFRPGKQQVLMLNACQTERHFRNVLRTHVREKPASELALILTRVDILFQDYPATSIALIKGLLESNSRQSILESIESAAIFHQSANSDADEAPLLYSSDLFL